jgi:hypothetical protein
VVDEVSVVTLTLILLLWKCQGGSRCKAAPTREIYNSQSMMLECAALSSGNSTTYHEARDTCSIRECIWL